MQSKFLREKNTLIQLNDEKIKLKLKQAKTKPNANFKLLILKTNIIHVFDKTDYNNK